MFEMTNTYETIIILDPLNHEDSVKVFRDMCQEFTKGYKIKEDDLGVKKLAYPLKEGKFTEGYYVRFVWMGTPENVAELERHVRIDDNVLKFITVRTEDAEDELEEMPAEDNAGESEQSSSNPNSQVDALDVLLGFADYKKEVE